MTRLHRTDPPILPDTPDTTLLAAGTLFGIAAVAVQLALVWGFDFFPSVDGSAHVHLAYAMYEALAGDPFYGSLVELNSQINPNVLAQSVLIALMAVASPLVAEKIWLTFYFVSFAAAAGYALAGFSRNALCLLPLFVFCSVSFSLSFGFYNFAFGTAVFLAWYGYWWRRRNSWSLSITAGHAAFAILAYATHLFAFVVTMLAIGITVTASFANQILRDPKGVLAHPRQLVQPLLSSSLPPLLGSLPVVAACVNFLFFRFRSGTVAGAAGLAIPLPDRVMDLLTATTFAPYDKMESGVAAAFVLVVIFLLLHLLSRRDRSGVAVPLASCFVAFVVFYLVMPQQWIVRWMPSRFMPLVFLTLLLWLAALMIASINRAYWYAVSTVGFTLVLVAVVVRASVFMRVDKLYGELASVAPFIATNSTLIGLRLHDTYHGRPFPAKVDVFIQVGSRLATIRHSVDLKNFQGQSSDHPVQFRPGVGASSALGGDRAITSVPPRVALMDYERRTGRPIDYVVLSGFTDAVDDRGALSQIDSQLAGNYRLVDVSRPTGFVRLYERCRDGKSGCAAPTSVGRPEAVLGTPVS